MNHREMKRLADDPEAVRSLARMLLMMNDCEWSDWEVDFLESMKSRDSAMPISIRQREVLVQLRERSEIYSTIDGFSVRNLIDGCWTARIELEEEDEQFISDLKLSGLAALRRRPLLKLLHCSRRLSLIENYVEIDR